MRCCFRCIPAEATACTSSDCNMENALRLDPPGSDGGSLERAGDAREVSDKSVESPYQLRDVHIRKLAKHIQKIADNAAFNGRGQLAWCKDNHGRLPPRFLIAAVLLNRPQRQP